MSPMSSVAVRRRIAKRFGLAGLALLSLVLGATACIFEKSDYQGGGRLDKGAAAKTADSASSTATTAPTDTSDATPPNPLPDAAGGG